MNLRITLSIIGTLLLLEHFFCAYSQSSDKNDATVLIHSDGSISCHVACAFIESATKPKMVTFHFGLPAIPYEKRWQEADDKPIFYSSWLDNGIRYIQTVFTTISQTNNPIQNPAQQTPNLLIVNIMGQSITNQYAEASAALKITFGPTNTQHLVLKDCVVNLKSDTELRPFAFLEVPAEGIAESKGYQLQFFGNMPPSISGSMTLKMPLTGNLTTTDWEALRDKDFSEELEKVKRHWAKQLKNTNTQPSLIKWASNTNQALPHF
jgi:hypothetical protein